MRSAEVKIEIGHRASWRSEPTKEGCSIIAHFVEKVVFHLHHTFASPRRVVKEPPYYVYEVGYAGFNLPNEIYFKSKKSLRRSISYVKCEKLTFVDPTGDFKEKLIKAGGVFGLPPGETQFEDLCAAPLKPVSNKKHLHPFTSKTNVSKQMLNFSGNEKSSCSGKDISASFNATAKQVKIDSKSNGHNAAYTSSSSSFSSISKEKIQKTINSKEKPSCKESNNSSKMVSNLSPLPSLKRQSDSLIPSENNQSKSSQSSSVLFERARNVKDDVRDVKDEVVKHKSSENKDISHSEYKDGNVCHKTISNTQKSSRNSKKKKKEYNLKDDKVSKYGDKRETKDDRKGLKKVNDNKKEVKKVKDDKHKVEIGVNSDKEDKSSKCFHSSSLSTSNGENDNEIPSNQNRNSENPTDANKSKSKQRKRS
ncbi:hypothetical protein ACJMK2_043523 [Sinanodonta woodiana]|uniref:YEATS domain-containing protein n=1 Tax=Sinanodonta woodiana TaxID=1069815 RepID=A0ABD3VYH8_SINWO